jgi:DHA1 family tetracycline resistance protein-like MFS transporter
MSDPRIPAQPRRAAFVFIFITVALDMLALGMIMPVLPKLVEGFVGGNTARASEIFGLFGTAWALMQFLFSPMLGALSDRFGRRPIVLLSNFGLGLDYVLMALAPSLAFLFAGRVISGICAATISTSYSYIADVTPADERAGRFGMLGAAFGLGFVVGPAVGGLLGTVDPRLPFWAAAAMSLLNWLYGLLVLPESLPRDRRAPFSWRKANPLGALKLLRSHPELSGLAGAGFISNLAHVVLPSVFVLYVGHRYGWNEGAVGLCLSAVGVSAIIVQAGLIGPAVTALGDRRALMTGLAFGMAGFAVCGLAPSGLIFCISIPLLALWGLASPTLLSLMSRRVGPSEQGQLQGANASLQGIANLAGPFLFTLTFSYFIGGGRDWGLPGAPFLLAAILLVISGAVAWRATRPR